MLCARRCPRESARSLHLIGFREKAEGRGMEMEHCRLTYRFMVWAAGGAILLSAVTQAEV